MDLKNFIREIPDFPKPGVLFRDITPLLRAPEIFSWVIEQFARKAKAASVDIVAGIESRGFLFGAPLALALKVPFVPIRKPGKLPAECMSIEYCLEYGSGRLDIHKDALEKGQRVALVDDLLASGGTAQAAVRLIELLGGQVATILFVVELTKLNGAARLAGYDHYSLVSC